MSETGELVDYNDDRAERLDDILVEEEDEVRGFTVTETARMGIFVYVDDICLYWQLPQPKASPVGTAQPAAPTGPATPASSSADTDVGVLCCQTGTEPLSRVIA